MGKVALLVVTLLVAGCGSHTHHQPPPTLSPATSIDDALLAYVPADTPYVFASFAAPMELRTESQRAVDTAELVTTLRNAAATRPAMHDFVEQIAKELLDGTRARTFEELGFGKSGRLVIYGVSLYPVMRAEIGDANRIRGLFDRLAKSLKPVRRDGDRWLIPVGSATFVADVGAKYVTLALVATSVLDAALPAILGQPKRALGRDVLEAAGQQYKLSDQWIAIVDFRKLVAELGNTGSPLAAPWATDPELAACMPDYARVTQTFTRVVGGYRRYDKSEVTGALHFETDLGAELANVHASIAVPESKQRPLMTLALAISYNELQMWLRGKAEALDAHPFQCPSMRSMGSGIVDLARSFGMGLTMLGGMRGAAVVIDELQKEPPSGSGVAVINGSQLQPLLSAIWAAMGMSVPSLQAGRPLSLPTAQLGLPGLTEAHAAIDADRFVIAVNGDSLERAMSAIQAPVKPMPLLSMDIDFPKLVASGLADGEIKGTAQTLDHARITLDATATSISIDFRIRTKQ